jgi:hypothetical protein
MLYTILEASKLIGISKVTAYKKINTVKELKQHITVKNNIQYIDTEGLDKLKALISKPVNCKEETENDDTNYQNKENSKVVNRFTDLQEDYIALLKQQLEEKDRQLSEKDKIISEHTELIRNSQVLFQQSQQKIFLLEQAKEEEKRSWWGKLFQ